jgi:uncharacterized protein (TIGR00290 family)
MASPLLETPHPYGPVSGPATPAIVSWSGGKDSMLALHRVLDAGTFKIESLLTTVTSGYDRISMHGVRVDLLREQARSLGLPLSVCLISPKATNGQYEDAMIRCLVQFAAKGIKHVICGDLFLADIRDYRARLFERVGMQGAFPLWLENTRALADEFISAGYKATLCCVDPKAISEDFAGRSYDDLLLAELPAGCDPCGENGEFHSFVYDGPLFSAPVKIAAGESVTREGFRFTDLVAAR